MEPLQWADLCQPCAGVAGSAAMWVALLSRAARRRARGRPCRPHCLMTGAPPQPMTQWPAMLSPSRRENRTTAAQESPEGRNGPGGKSRRKKGRSRGGRERKGAAGAPAPAPPAHLHRLHRVGARRGLARKHHAVGAVQHLRMVGAPTESTIRACAALQTWLSDYPGGTMHRAVLRCAMLCCALSMLRCAGALCSPRWRRR